MSSETIRLQPACHGAMASRGEVPAGRVSLDSRFNDASTHVGQPHKTSTHSKEASHWKESN